MPDDLDNQIRAAMKVLDEQTPSGYFDAAPNQILARLEDGSMQHGSRTTELRNNRDALMGPPVVPDDADTNPTPKVESSAVTALPAAPAAAAAAPTAAAAAAAPGKAAADRDEDSGLHDIRNLAQSTKQRLSARRITMNPPSSDDTLASSSGSFANIALPQPAKMVALPDLEDLPSKQEVIAAQKAAAKARKTKAPTIEPSLASKDILAPQATANAALASLTAAPVAEVAAPPVRQAFTLPSMERKKSKGPILAIMGLGVAAAAGGLIFMNTNKSADKTASQNVAAENTAPAAPTVAPIAAAGSAAVEAPAPAPAPEVAPVEEVKAVDTGAAEAAVAGDSKSEPRAKRGGKGGGKKADAEDKKVEEPKVVVETKPEVKEIKTPDGVKKAGGGEAEPSFDALLKEAGVDDKKKEKPKLEKKSLNGDDFKKGMASINSKAQGCYKGTQGTASVKLTVSPDGKVTKVSVGGQFAGKPEGSCVESAVKGATFPAWDGGPQSFNYSYMLSD